MNYASKQIIELKNLVSRYRSIPHQAHHDFIHFYEQYFTLIQQLDFDEIAEMKYTYIKSLHYLDLTSLFHKHSDIFIEELLNHSEFLDRHRMIYQEVLFLKACTLQNEMKSEQAQTVLTSLIRINNQDKRFQSTLRKNLFHNALIKNRIWLAGLIAIFIFTLIVTFIQLLFVKHFFEDWNTYLVIVRNISFVCGVSLMTILFILIKWNIHLKITSILKKNNS